MDPYILNKGSVLDRERALAALRSPFNFNYGKPLNNKTIMTRALKCKGQGHSSIVYHKKSLFNFHQFG